MINIREAFGEPIGNYAGTSAIGVRDEPTAEKASICKKCKLMPIGGACGCGTYVKENSKKVYNEASCNAEMGVGSGSCSAAENDEPCRQCGMMETEIGQGCGCMKEAKRRGPSKKTAKKILKGTKTFKDKMKKVSGWADDPAAAAAWMMKKAYDKWPSQK